MRTDHSACAFPVDIKITHKELTFGLVHFSRIGAEDCASQTVLGIIGELQGVIEVLCFGDGKNGTENLFLEDTRFRTDISNDYWLDEISFASDFLTASDEPSFGLADFDVFQDAFLGAVIDDRAHIITDIIRW